MGRQVDVLVGRGRELSGCVDSLRLALSGRCAGIVVEGEAGIGKTRLVDALVDEAAGHGVVIRRGSAHPFEGTRPFGAICDALQIRVRSTDPRAAAIAGLLTGERETDQSGPITDVRHRVVEEMLDLVELLCAGSPTVIVLEDLHWADDSTLLALRALACGLSDVPLLVVATLRPAPRSTALDQLLDDLRGIGARMFRLEALDPADVDALARAELGGPPGAALRELLGRAAGNPLWLVELLHALADEGRMHEAGGVVDVDEPSLPGSFAELVVRRLRYLSDDTLSMLKTAAVLGDSVSVHELAAVSGLSSSDVTVLLEEAFRARLLVGRDDGAAFRHQLVHDAVYESLPKPLRRAMHRDAATVLEAGGAEPARVADHLVRGADRGDLGAVEGLRRAARAGIAGAPATSVDLLRRAESLLPGGHGEADVVAAELVDAMLRAGMVSDAAARAEAVLDRSHRDDIDLRLRLSLVSAMSVQNRTHDLINVAEVLAANDDLDDRDRALVLDQASLGRALASDVLGGEDAARRALTLAERANDAPMIVWSLAVGSVPLKEQGRYREALELTSRAVEIASHEAPEARLRHPQFFHGMVLSDADRYDEARVAFGAALDEYDTLGSAWLLSDTLLMIATADFVTGNWNDAVPGFDAGLETAREQGNHILLAPSHAYLAIMAIAGGDPARAAEALEPFADQLVSPTPVHAAELVAYASAILAAESGDTARAYKTLQQLWDFDTEREIRVYQRYLAPPLVCFALEHGHRDVAQRVVDQTQVSAVIAPEVATVRACAARCRGLVDGDADRLIEAVELARRGPRVLDHAGACEDAARLLVDAGRREEATPLLSEALERYEAIGANAWATRVNAALRTLGVRRGVRGQRRRSAHGWESLTPTERSVTELVAQGLTNREAAKRLHMSPHTVNTHLRHIYEKLGIGNRTALAAAVSRSIE